MLSASEPSPSPAPPKAWKPVPGQALKQPLQLRPNAAGVVDVKLTATTKTIFVSGRPLQATPFNGRLQGPTIHVAPGGTIKVSFDNQLKSVKPPPGFKDDLRANIHYHGLHVSPLGISDNVFRTFEPNSINRSRVKVPRNQTPGTFWYHVHFHGNSDQQVMGGLAGMLIIDGLERRLPKRLRGIPQRQLALQSVQVTGNQINGQNNINPGEPTATRLVSTQYKPRFSMKSRRYELWRLANIGSDDFFEVGFQGHHFVVIAEDGTPVWNVTRRSRLVMPPGKRFDVLVLGGRPGTYFLQSRPYAQSAETDKRGRIAPTYVPAKPMNIAQVRVTAAAPVQPVARPPRHMAPRHDLRRYKVDRKYTFRFSYLPGQGFKPAINGRLFHPDELPAAAPVLGEVEEWTLINKTTDDHPFHIHVNDFQVMRVNSQPYPANGTQDVVIIPKQRTIKGKTVDGTVVIRNRYTDFDGWFVFHCHILDHEDFGMMATVQVRKNASVPITPPPGTLPPTQPAKPSPHEEPHH